MVAFTILAGGFDLFVATYLFNSSDSSLSLLSKSPTGSNPSWITTHLMNRSILYAVNEVAQGALQTFEVSPCGALSYAIDTTSSGGDNPAFVAALSTGQVAVVNYGGGNGRIIQTTESGLRFDQEEVTPIVTFPRLASGAPHPHMALEHGDEILVPDLGGDTIWRLSKSGSIQGSISQPKSSGPRHIAIYGQHLFTLHELSSTLTVQLIPPAPNGTSPIISSVSIIPSNPPPNATYAAAEILIPTPTKDFPVPYIYVSNRNKGFQDARGDSIAIFEHVNVGTPEEGLLLVKQVFTGLSQIRGMQFGKERRGEAFLVAGGVVGDAGIVVFKRVDQGRDLEVVARNREVPTRSTFVWL